LLLLSVSEESSRLRESPLPARAIRTLTTSSLLDNILIPVLSASPSGTWRLSHSYISLQAAMPISEMATSTSTVGLFRSMGGTIGISVGGELLLLRFLLIVELY
jgi:hypothetical protein